MNTRELEAKVAELEAENKTLKDTVTELNRKVGIATAQKIEVGMILVSKRLSIDGNAVYQVESVGADNFVVKQIESAVYQNFKRTIAYNGWEKSYTVRAK